MISLVTLSLARWAPNYLAYATDSAAVPEIPVTHRSPCLAAFEWNQSKAARTFTASFCLPKQMNSAPAVARSTRWRQRAVATLLSQTLILLLRNHELGADALADA